MYLIHATTIYATAFNASLHCTDCVDPASVLDTNFVDGSGNPASAVFAYEIDADDACDNCLTLINP